MKEVLLNHLLGTTVRDADGPPLGCIEEVCAEIELTDRGNDYVVVAFLVGSYGALGWLARTTFSRHTLRLFGRFPLYRVQWDWMDLSDPARPVCVRRKEDVPLSV